MNRLVRIAILSAALFATPGIVRAEDPSADSLYQSAERAFSENRVDDACQLLRQSYDSEQRLITLHRLGWYEESASRLATAATVYDTYISRYERLDEFSKIQERETGRLEFVRNHREALEPQIPTVVLTLADRIPGTRVLRKVKETEQMTTLALGVPLPLDPGWHILTVQVPFREDRISRFYIRPGEHLTLTLDLPDAVGPRAYTPHQPVAPVPNILPPMDPGPSGQRIAAWVTGGIGIAGIITGAVFGTLTWLEKDTIDENCNSDGLCSNKAGDDAKDNAKTYGALSTGMFVGGAVLLTTGIILYVTEPSQTRTVGTQQRLQLSYDLVAQGGILKGTIKW